ncbi:MAG: 3-phosphoshikimate 1-carboxyvinyltransferase [Caloramator sp.]|nr:3-phosphoshikimate 1-carboxyvinyltransferase [Caloramator sp.]
MDFITKKSNKLNGRVKLQGDKSISHRAALILPLCHGDAVVKNFLFAEDTMNSLKAMRMLGADIKIVNDEVHFKARGIKSLKPTVKSIYLGNSGTSIRLISGILSSIDGYFAVYGDDSLCKRPMKRIIDPLNMMGARVKSILNNDKAPLLIKGGKLKGIEHSLEVPSAQVKSAIILAALNAEGETKIKEKVKARDHTERMLKYLGADLEIGKDEIRLRGGQKLQARDIFVPSDFSSAAFIITAAALTENSEVIIEDVLLNPTRTGFLEAFRDMGGQFEILDLREANNELIGSIKVYSSKLKGITIEGAIIPRIIDEIPLIAVLAAFAEGETLIKDAQELKYKESNRIESIAYNLKEMGIEYEIREDGLKILGNTFVVKDKYNFYSFKDHRIAMAFALVGFVLDNVRVYDCDNVRTSFPDFIKVMEGINGKINMI